MIGGMGWFVVGSAVLAVACGGDSGATHDSQGGNGPAGAGAGSTAGASGSGGSIGGSALGGEASDGGDATSGSAGNGGSAPALDYTFRLVPPLPPRRTPPGANADSPVTTQVTQAVVSADGTRIAGDMVYTAVTDGVTFMDSSAYLWSEATGSLPLPGPVACLASDGSWAIGMILGDTGSRAYRANQAGDIEMLEVEGHANASISIASCAADGSAVIGDLDIDGQRSLAFWRHGRNQDRFVQVLIPNAQTEYGVTGRLSGDGSLLVIHSYVGDKGATQLHTLPTDGPPDALHPLENPNGYDECFSSSVSTDGTTVLGRCIDDQDRLQAVVWNEAGAPSVREAFFLALGNAETMTADGAIVAGLTESGNLGVWQDGAILPSDYRGTWLTISGTGSDAVAYAYDDADGKVLAWTTETGVAPFPTNNRWSTIWGASADGQLALGASSLTADEDTDDAELSDPHGIRNLRDTLTAAGLDLTGIGQLRPRRVISAGGARIIGNSLVDGASRVWVATLPPRTAPNP